MKRLLFMYTLGFIFSIILTIEAYLLVVHHTLNNLFLTTIILILAVVQCLVQLFFFLHIGDERKPRWKLMTLLLMLLVVSIVLCGSLWIMHNLNYRMSPSQMNQYLKSQDGF